MKASHKYSKLERITYTLDEHEVRDAIVAYIKERGKMWPKIPEGGKWAVEWWDEYEGGEPSGKTIFEATQEFCEDVEAPDGTEAGE